MMNATHDQAIKQALRIRKSCKGGGETCVSIIPRLLDHDPPLSERQRATLLTAAVLMGRYGIGVCCGASIREMPEEVRNAYAEKYGKIPPKCCTCKDTRLHEGLICLACRVVAGGAVRRVHGVKK